MKQKTTPKGSERRYLPAVAPVTASIVVCVFALLLSATVTRAEESTATTAALTSVEVAEQDVTASQDGAVATTDTAGQAEDSATSGDEANDDEAPVSEDGEPLENSWRYQDGRLRSDLEESVEGMGDGISLLSENGLWGVDVSYHNGVIDWAKAKAAGVQFAILRLGYGDDNLDSKFVANVQGCKAAGIKIGVYFYSYAWDYSSALAEARGALSLLSRTGVKPEDLSLPIYYDMENEHNGRPAGVSNKTYHYIKGGAATFASMATVFCSAMEDAGYTAGVYANLNWWNSYLTDGVFNNWERWVAQYNSTNSYRGNYSAWQYTSSGKVDGIGTNVDLNWFYGDFINHDAGVSLSSLGTKVTSLDSGEYFIVPYISGVGNSVNGALTIDSGSSDNGAKAVLNSLSADASQAFTFSSNGDGSFTIRGSSGKVLDASGPSFANGTPIIQWDSNKGDNQKWTLYRDPSGWYYIASVYAGGHNKVIDLPNGSSEVGTGFQLWGANGSEAQRFRLVKKSDYKANLNGWQTIGGVTYWYDDGVRAEGKSIYDSSTDAWLWIDPDGTIAKNKDAYVPAGTTGKWVRLDTDGHMVKGEDYRYGGWYNFDVVTGEMCKGVRHVDSSGGKWVYYDVVTGQMAHGEAHLSYDAEHTGWYLFDGVTGAMCHGDTYVRSSGGKWVRYDDVTGKMVKGLDYRYGAWYYFDPVTGAMAHGNAWVPEWGRMHYFDQVTGRG